MKSINNKKIGVLVVNGEHYIENGSYRIDVICEVCGHEKSVDKYTFFTSTGRCTSCGAGHPKDRELIGKKFSNFTITGWPVKNNGHKFPVSCNKCGKDYFVSKCNIQHAVGVCPSCGNGKKEIDHTGTRVGDFLVISATKKDGSRYVAEVRCQHCRASKTVDVHSFLRSKGRCDYCYKYRSHPRNLFNYIRKQFVERNPQKICGVCGISEWNGNPLTMDVDHIVARCNGGEDKIENLRWICPNCHRQKTEEDVTW